MQQVVLNVEFGLPHQREYLVYSTR